MRRKPGTLLPLEASILAVGVEGRGRGEPEFHGFAAAKAIRDGDASRRLTSHGTLYKALERLERAGLLESRWEDPDVAVSEGRPRRRLYRVTGDGELALSRARLTAAEVSGGLAPA
jgi:DNA-binding PadR family transcriptional regulator